VLFQNGFLPTATTTLLLLLLLLLLRRIDHVNNILEGIQIVHFHKGTSRTSTRRRTSFSTCDPWNNRQSTIRIIVISSSTHDSLASNVNQTSMTF
jgi:hypothetical protein